MKVLLKLTELLISLNKLEVPETEDWEFSGAFWRAALDPAPF